MVAREHSAELSVHRRVRILDPHFLPSVRKVASVAFGERHVGIMTLRPPLVALANAAEEITEPNTKTYDAENVDLRYIWRIAKGDKADKYAGSKLFKARAALEDGVRDKTKPKKTGLLPQYIVPPLEDLMRTATSEYEIFPESTFKLVCGGITSFRNEISYPGKVIYALTPDMSTDSYRVAEIEQAVAEDTLQRISRYASALPIPQPPLVIPFLRVSEDHLPEGQEQFIETMQRSNVFPSTVEMQPLEFSLRS